ncbi:MAG: alpha-L-fucosidase [Marinilabiliales bacterium]|nr:alpha-L-fucosidase [Marinilabiliales bacterium]
MTASACSIPKPTDFDVMSTPFKRDILKELAAACKKYGHEALLLPFDHGLAPPRLPARAAPWDDKRGRTPARTSTATSRYMKAPAARSCSTGYGADRRPVVRRRVGRHLDRRARARPLRLRARLSSPTIIINNRVGQGPRGHAGHGQGKDSSAITARRSRRSRRPASPGVDWETCMTMNDNWGYNKARQELEIHRGPDPQPGRHAPARAATTS